MNCTQFDQDHEQKNKSLPEWSSYSSYALCSFSVIYLFDAQTGKPIGDGKPLTHKVNDSVILPSTEHTYTHIYNNALLLRRVGESVPSFQVGIPSHKL